MRPYQLHFPIMHGPDSREKSTVRAIGSGDFQFVLDGPATAAPHAPAFRDGARAAGRLDARICLERTRLYRCPLGSFRVVDPHRPPSRTLVSPWCGGPLPDGG